jgi:hypothetical protein
MVPFARRVRTIRMCSLDARGLGPIQATHLKARNKLRRLCLGKARPWAKKLSWQTQGGRVRSLAFLSILRGRCPLGPDVQAIEVLLCQYGFPQPARKESTVRLRRMPPQKSEPVPWAPRASLATRLGDFATNRHE